MSEDRDRRIANLIRGGAPPPRDPAFRLRVLERREHRQFQRRLFTMLATVLLIVLVATFGVSLGGRIIGEGTLEATGALVVGTALAGAHFAFRGRLLRTLRRFSL